jgi:hypothetical protein
MQHFEVVIGVEANESKKLLTQTETADTTEWHFPK